jgi:hypothetical protein
LRDWDPCAFNPMYNGGSPRCPNCLKSSAVAFNGYNSKIAGNFHCNRCKVCWHDIGQALCYVCDKPFAIPPMTGPLARLFLRDTWAHGTCYHLNQCDRPFCPRCEQRIGADTKHRRRQLRRMVGLRG